MTGYMSVLLNNVYDGRFTNGTSGAIANGMIMKADATGTKLVLPAADTAFTGVVVEKTTIYDTVEANEIVITGTGTTRYYFVENQFDYNDSDAYDTTTYTVAAGEYLRAHPLEAGERFYVAGTATAGTAVSLKATGLMG